MRAVESRKQTEPEGTLPSGSVCFFAFHQKALVPFQIGACLLSVTLLLGKCEGSTEEK